MPKKTNSLPAQNRAPSAAERPATPVEAAAALALVMPQIQAYPESSLRRITLDIPRGVSIASAAHTRIMPLRPLFLAQTPATPIDYVDGLKTYAMAAWYAHLAAMPKPSASVEKLKAEATVLRADLLMGAEPLAYKNYFSKEALVKIKAGTGYIDLANDNVALSALYTGAWDAVENRTFVEWAQVERAAIVGPELLVALGEKIGYGATPSESEQIKVKAVSLFLDVYDELARAMGYIRWHEGDARSLLPSLYQGGPRRSAQAPADADTAAEAAGALDAGAEDAAPSTAPATPDTTP